MEPLSTQQQLQEESYLFPYHWVKTYQNTGGRLFLGYVDAAIGLSSLQALLATGAQPLVLDAGCGDGRLLKELHDRGATQLYGSDYSKRAIDFATLLAPYATYSVNDLTKHTSFIDHSFDIVFMIETLEHIIPDRIPAMMQEIARILKPGGELIITVPSQAVPVSPHHYQHFTKESLTHVLATHFSVETIVGQDSIPFHPLKLVSWLIQNPYITFPRLAEYYNRYVWGKYFNICSPENGRRIMARARYIR